MRWLGSRGNWLWTALLVSLAFNVGFSATYGWKVHSDDQCPRPEPRPAGKDDHRKNSLREKLNLTPQQEEQMNALREQMMTQGREAWQNLRTERAALAELLTAETPNRAAIAAQIDKLMIAQRQTQERMVENLLAEKALLQPEQQAAFNEMIRHRSGPREGKWRPEGEHPNRKPPAPAEPPKQP